MFGAVRTLPLVETARCATEEELVVDLHDFVSPEFIGVEDVRGKQFGSNAPSQVLDSFAASR